MKLFVGCDLGGTNIKAGLVDMEAGLLIHSKSTPTQAQQGHEFVIQKIALIIRDILSEAKLDLDMVEGVGVGIPGLLDLNKGVTLFLPNLSGHWLNVPFREMLMEQLDGKAVSILNDSRAITLGEYYFGAGRGVNDMICLTLGTGVGGGVIVRKELLLNLGGAAGELGHQTIAMDGPKCGCGNTGCLEVFASASAIAQEGVIAMRQGLSTQIAQLANFDSNNITAELIAQAAQAGDAVAMKIWQKAGEALGTAIANLIVTFGPERIVLCGGVAKAGDLLLAPIKKTIHQRVYMVPLKDVQVLSGLLGDAAGIWGMAKWAMQQSQKDKRSA